jgi:hypothetical protein
MTARPGRTEAAEYYFTYINQVADGEIVGTLEAQAKETAAFLRGIPDAKAGHRYAEGKWSLREVVCHINDTERLFVFRAMWFARGFDTPLPSFDQDVALAASNADARPWADLIDEFAAIRASTIAFFRSLPADAWMRRGTASGNPFTVRALAFITAGHTAHHVRIVKERYLSQPVKG